MFNQSVLENGIRIVTDSMSQMRTVAISVVVRSGSRNDPDDKSGIAHLTEHLMFQGTNNRNSLQIAQFMDEIGGQIGAFTSRDYTCYTAIVLDDYYTFAIDLLGDILLNSIFPETEFENQRKTIIREIMAAVDFPNQFSNTLLKSKIWANHPLGRPVDGERLHLKKFIREDLIHFFRTHYTSNRIIVAAAGNLEHDDFVSHVKDAFWRMASLSPLSVQAPPVFHRGVHIQECGLSQSYFSIGIKSLPFAHRDRYALHVINRLLGGGISSRLFRRIREEKGLVYEISSEYHAYFDDGLLIVEGSTSSEYLLYVIKKTIGILHGLFSGKQPIEEDELWKVKNQMMAEHMIDSESTYSRMSRLAMQVLYFDRHISNEEILNNIDSMTVDYVQAISSTVLLKSLDKLAVTIVGPNGIASSDQLRIEDMLSIS